jgi:hypothetical protein
MGDIEGILTKNICNKDAVKLGRFELLRQFDPVVNVVETPRFVVRMLP